MTFPVTSVDIKKPRIDDLRNTKVIDIVRELAGYHAKVDIYDPWIDIAEVEHEYQVTPASCRKPTPTTPSSSP